MLANRMMMGAAGTGGGGDIGGIDSYTKLYLPMTGDDESTVFLDSGQNSISDGLLGDACGYFDGTGDYLTVPDNADWDFGSGDFTIDVWAYVPSAVTSGSILDHRIAATTNSFLLNLASSKIGFYSSIDGSNWTIALLDSDSCPKDEWFHIAVVRNGSDLDLYINGTSKVSDSEAGAITTQATSLLVGKKAATAEYFTGFLQELRISNTARYTTGFTPSTTPFTSDANTKLLLHMDTEGSTTFTDSGNTGHTVTTNGNTVQVTGHPVLAVADAQVDTAIADPFGGNSGVLLLDGTGDYLTIPYDANDWDFGTDDLTIDLWFRKTDGTTGSVFGGPTSMGAYETRKLDISATSIYFYYQYETGPDRNLTGWNHTNTVGVWYHLAIVRNGNTFRCFIDGVDLPVSNFSATYTGSMSFDYAALPMLIGGIYADNYGAVISPLAGYVSNLRISKGIDRTQDSTDPMYNGGTPGDSFTPPTGPYTE